MIKFCSYFVEHRETSELGSGIILALPSYPIHLLAAFGDGKKPLVSAENPSIVTPNPRKQAPFGAAVDWALQRLDNAPFPVD